MTIEELQKQVIAFRDERNWKQFHNPKDVALSLSLEASELLENFQWKTSDEAFTINKESITDELADVVIYALLFADEAQIDLAKAVQQKIKKNALKYPVEKAKGNKSKYTEL